MNNNISFIIALSLFMVANILSGVIKARKLNSFVFTTLKEGVINYLLWLLTFTSGVLAINYVPNLSLKIGQEVLEISKLLDLSKGAIISLYAYKFIKNILEYHNLKVTQLTKNLEIKEDSEVG